MLATVVEVQDLWRTVVAALVGGVGITIVFSLAIYGGTQFADARRHERSLATAAAGLLTLLTLAGTIAAVVFGLIVMTSK